LQQLAVDRTVRSREVELKRNVTHEKILWSLCDNCNRRRMLRPFCAIGARVRLPLNLHDTCVLATMGQAFGQKAFDTLDVHHDTTISISSRDLVRLPGTSPVLYFGPRGDTAVVLEITSWWMGHSDAVPMPQQRQFVAAATSTLESIRSACAPASAARVECVTRGVAKREACGV